MKLLSSEARNSATAATSSGAQGVQAGSWTRDDSWFVLRLRPTTTGVDERRVYCAGADNVGSDVAAFELIRPRVSAAAGPTGGALRPAH